MTDEKKPPQGAVDVAEAQRDPIRRSIWSQERLLDKLRELESALDVATRAAGVSGEDVLAIALESIWDDYRTLVSRLNRVPAKLLE